MSDVLKTRIERGRELLGTIRHAAAATVNEDGSPHNTPVHYVIDQERKYIYWASSPTSLHSRNLERTGRAFIAIYEANVGGGLFVDCVNVHVVEADELSQGVEIWNAQRAAESKPSATVDLFTGDSPQRMYRAEIAKYSVNYSEKDEAGNIICDIRQEVNREELL